MDILENINEIGNKLANNLDLKNIQERFLESTIGQIANSAIDFGIKAALPDYIEDEVIDVKNALINGGIKEGVNTAIENAVKLGKNILGIENSSFENLGQAQETLNKGKVLEGISDGIDFVINKLENSKIISENISSLIKGGKDLIINNINNNIENEFSNEMKALEKINKYIDNWKECYNNKDLKGLNNQFNKIEKQMKKILPLENILNNVKKIENINELINNSDNFNFDNIYLDLASAL